MSAKQCIVCASPLPRYRSRFCSDRCSAVVHHRHAYVPVEEALPVYADDAPAELTPKELRRRNKQLAQVGRRICRTHQGAALPLTAEYFYATDCRGRLDTQCKACQKQRVIERAKARYQEDPAFRVRRRAHFKTDRERHLLARRASVARNMRNYRLRRKAAQFARLLAGAQP